MVLTSVTEKLFVLLLQDRKILNSSPQKQYQLSRESLRNWIDSLARFCILD